MTVFLNLIRIGPPPNQAIFVSGFKLDAFSIHANELAPTSLVERPTENFLHCPRKKNWFSMAARQKKSHAMNASAGWLASSTGGHLQMMSALRSHEGEDEVRGLRGIYRAEKMSFYLVW